MKYDQGWTQGTFHHDSLIALGHTCLTMCLSPSLDVTWLGQKLSLNSQCPA